jgi:hypothetical protein
MRRGAHLRELLASRDVFRLGQRLPRSPCTHAGRVYRAEMPVDIEVRSGETKKNFRDLTNYHG